jgi:hypothetical protein
LNALDHVETELADFAGDVMMYRPDLARSSVWPAAGLGAGGSDSPRSTVRWWAAAFFFADSLM